MGTAPSARMGRQPAFLLAALLALALLGGGLVSVTRQVTRTPPAQRMETACEELGIIAQALALYKAHVGHYPGVKESGLLALVVDPGIPEWRGPYLNHIIPDPWGRPYQYLYDAEAPLLFSMGPDKRPGTEDDLHASSEDFVLSEETAADWSSAAPRIPTVEILTTPSLQETR